MQGAENVYNTDSQELVCLSGKEILSCVSTENSSEVSTKQTIWFGSIMSRSQIRRYGP
jgi:hypothetical protein